MYIFTIFKAMFAIKALKRTRYFIRRAVLDHFPRWGRGNAILAICLYNHDEALEYANVRSAFGDVMYLLAVVSLETTRNTLIYLCNPRVSQVPRLAVRIRLLPVTNGWSETKTAWALGTESHRGRVPRTVSVAVMGPVTSCQASKNEGAKQNKIT